MGVGDGQTEGVAYALQHGCILSPALIAAGWLAAAASLPLFPAFPLGRAAGGGFTAGRGTGRFGAGLRRGSFFLTGDASFFNFSLLFHDTSPPT
jgi:hypothetical protein